MAGVWTDNWHGLKNSMLLWACRSGWGTIKSLAGETLTTIYSYVHSPMCPFENNNSPSNSSNTNVIVFGTGVGEPAATDYCLAAKWTANISRVSLSESNSYNDTTHTKTKTVTCTVQNTGSASVTIREWGIECKEGSTAILLYRALLDTPVTLQQYESATFTCHISMRLTDPM